MTRYLTLLILLVWTLLLLTSCQPKPPRALEGIENYAVYYGLGKAEELSQYDLAVVQPNTLSATELAQLKASGTRVAVYLSVGEVEPSRDWFSDGRVPEDWLLGSNEAWGSYYVDANQAGWRDLIVALAADYLAQGFDGFFLDTVDTALIFPDTEAGMLTLIQGLRKTYPNAIIIQNRGLPLAPRTARFIDAVMFENISTSYDFASDTYEYADFSFDARQLQTLAKNTGLTILALDYAAPDNPAMAYRATKTAESYGFIPSVSTILLDDIPDYGLTEGGKDDIRIVSLEASASDGMIEVQLENAGLKPAKLVPVSLTVNGEEIASTRYDSVGIGERKVWLVDWPTAVAEADIRVTAFSLSDTKIGNNTATLNYNRATFAEEPILPLSEQRLRDTEPQLVALPLNDPLTIDGDLSDWRAASCNKLSRAEQITYGDPSNWTGPDDLSGVACFLWDSDNLYMSVDVTDDVLEQAYSGTDMWHGDHVEVWIDTQLQLDFDSARESADDFQLGFSPGNFDTTPSDIFIWTPPTPSERYEGRVEYGVARTERGYTLEVRLPKLVLKGLKLEPQHAVGLAVALSDTDTSDLSAQETMLASSADLLWGVPSTFNTLVFKDNRQANLPTAD